MQLRHEHGRVRDPLPVPIDDATGERVHRRRPLAPGQVRPEQGDRDDEQDDSHGCESCSRTRGCATSFTPVPAPPASGPRDHRPAVLAGFLGWTLDAFDFFLVVMTLTAIAHEFGRSDKEIAYSISLTLAFRPVGAFVFGLLADRYGRRLPLMLDLVFFSLVEVLSGLAPNYATFMVLRALFGIGMGGEWGVGASLVMEKVPPRYRGMVSGLLQQGYAAGYLLAAVCYFFVFPRWGWRPLFFIGGLPALLGLFVRYRGRGAGGWARPRHESWGPLGRGIGV